MAFSEGVKSLSISRQTGIQTKQVVEIIKTLDRSLASDDNLSIMATGFFARFCKKSMHLASEPVLFAEG